MSSSDMPPQISRKSKLRLPLDDGRTSELGRPARGRMNARAVPVGGWRRTSACESDRLACLLARRDAPRARKQFLFLHAVVAYALSSTTPGPSIYLPRLHGTRPTIHTPTSTRRVSFRREQQLHSFTITQNVVSHWYVYTSIT